MSTGLYPDNIVVERYLLNLADETLVQPFVAPFDIDVLGLLATVAVAPGAGNKFNVNVSNFPTSQQGGALASVSAYNLWTAANVPTISGTATASYTTSNSGTVIENQPYALNYPFPGPAGTVAYQTSQATAQTTSNPVTAPPVTYQYKLVPPVGPDATYTDYNGNTLPASLVHAGDVLSFTLNGTGPGSASGLSIVLFGSKR
jgi:hypothetical protein